MGETVLLQFGQGGIQFGSAFLDALRHASASSSSSSSSAAPPRDFFREEHLRRRSSSSASSSSSVVARAVLIDTEPKVAAAAVSRRRSPPSWRYAPQNALTSQQSGGSGNNWAWGFCKNGPQCQEAAVDLVRREVEKCDIFSGFVSLQSLAGGTGGGVGALILETLRDEYPTSFMLSCCLWPLAGEVSVQPYNVLLSIAHLHHQNDGIVVMSNEALLGACRKALGIQRPSFQDMNELGARALASVLLPASFSSFTTKSRGGAINVNGKGTFRQESANATKRQHHHHGSSISSSLFNILSGLCAHPHYRMLSLRATPQMPAGQVKQTTYSWRSHLKQLKRMMYAPEPPPPFSNSAASPLSSSSMDRCLANLLVLRGDNLSQADASLFDDRALYPIWSVQPLTVATHPARLGDYDMFAGLLSNCLSAIAPASHFLSTARAMYSSKAYVHHYSRHGLEPDVFEESFATVEEILEHYQAL